MTNGEIIFPGGITGEMLVRAIQDSGHPTQYKAANKITSLLRATQLQYEVQEEWSFVDSDTDTVRQLDLVATVDLGRNDPANDKTYNKCDDFVSCYADFLIECKRSELPLVFSLRKQWSTTPEIWGLPHDQVVCSSRSGIDTYIRTEGAIGAYEMQKGQHVAVSVSKVMRKGKAVELSGADIFRNLTLPVMKAVDNYKELTRGGPDHRFHRIHFIYPVVIVDAPMVGFTLDEGQPVLDELKCVRLALTEPGDEWHLSMNNRRRAIDFIALDYVEEYFASAITRSREFGRRTHAFAQQIVTGRAKVNDELPGSLDYETLGVELDPDAEREWVRENKFSNSGTPHLIARTRPSQSAE